MTDYARIDNLSEQVISFLLHEEEGYTVDEDGYILNADGCRIPREKGPEEVGVAQPSKSGKALNLLYGGWLYFVPLKALRNLVEGKTDKASVMLPVPSGGF